LPDPRHIAIDEFDYPLPANRIAAYPLEERDASRLLVYKDGSIDDSVYLNLSAYIPQNSLLVFNDTRVIRARILFQKATGGVIEIFCLEPAEAISDYQVIMSKNGSVKWKCMIGGASKWKEGPVTKTFVINGKEIGFTARLLEKEPDAYIVEFSWQPGDLCFSEIIELAGCIPLPPYIKRTAEDMDTGRYQTIYAKEEGSVAAPTAGLHFTPAIFESLKEKNIETGFVTLHVGAGTFKPVKANTMGDHIMHAEWIDVELAFIEKLMGQSNTVMAVGTTSARTLESLYWMGVKVIIDPGLKQLQLEQWDVYSAPLQDSAFTKEAALKALTEWLRSNQHTRLFTQTKLFIAPGYRFRMIGALITNFHQPRSTLLLLVAAAVGKGWKRVYEHALENGYRFLSYGDGCLLFIH